MLSPWTSICSGPRRKGRGSPRFRSRFSARNQHDVRRAGSPHCQYCSSNGSRLIRQPNRVAGADDTISQRVRRRPVIWILPGRVKSRPPSTHAYKSEGAAQDFLADVLTHDNGVRNAIPANQGRDDDAALSGEYDVRLCSSRRSGRSGWLRRDDTVGNSATRLRRASIGYCC